MGVYAAIWLCLETLFLKRAENWAVSREIDLKDPLVQLFRRSYMFLIFIHAALVFRATSLEQFWVMIVRMFTQWQFSEDFLRSALDCAGLTLPVLLQIVLSLVSLGRLQQWCEFDLSGAKTLYGSRQRLSTAILFVLIIALGWLALLATEDAAGFAYFQF